MVTKAEVVDRRVPGTRFVVSDKISEEDFPYAVAIWPSPSVLGSLGVLVCDQGGEEETRQLAEQIADLLTK